VRHDYKGVRTVLDVIFEPEDGIHIEMVRRLVQEKNVRLHKQSSGQCYTHTPATGKITGFGVLHVMIESETMEDSSRFSRLTESVNFFQTFQDLDMTILILGFLGLRKLGVFF
jgi:16S rRNA U1498 N3-methylase RsmE